MTTRITIERQELAVDAQRIAMQLSKLAAHAAEEGLDLAGPVESMTDELSGMTVALTAGRDLHCRCGAAALEMAYWPRTGRAGMAGTLDALMRGDEMVGHTVCIKHAEGSYVGHALCPCGDRAGYIATMGPDAARRARRYDPDLWVEYDDGAYLLCGDCTISADCEVAGPWQDSRPGPEQGPMLATLLRRVRALEDMGYGTSAAFHIMSTTIEGGFLRKPIQWLNLHAEQLAPLAGDFSQEDLEFANHHLETHSPDESTLERLDFLDRAIEASMARRPEESGSAEVLAMPAILGAAGFVQNLDNSQKVEIRHSK